MAPKKENKETQESQPASQSGSRRERAARR
jgi:hypothetical protein